MPRAHEGRSQPADGRRLHAGAILKERRPAVHVVAVEPAGPPCSRAGPPSTASRHRGGLHSPLLDLSLIDEVIAVEDTEAFTAHRRLTQREGTRRTSRPAVTVTGHFLGTPSFTSSEGVEVRAALAGPRRVAFLLAELLAPMSASSGAPEPASTDAADDAATAETLTQLAELLERATDAAQNWLGGPRFPRIPRRSPRCVTA